MSIPARTPKVLVLGGTGFVGRHAVAALKARGARPIVGTRAPNRPRWRLPREVHGLERRAVQHERCLTPEDWQPLLADVDAVINAVGILRPRGRATYERVHHLAPAALARACLHFNIPLIHVSALGLRADARSRFLSSKKRGEHALFAAQADIVIVRPSLLIGPGGFGARWIARVANWLVHPLPTSARSRISAFRVEELGLCLATLACMPRAQRRRYQNCAELGGPSLTTMSGLLLALRTHPFRPFNLRIPAWVARLIAHVCDALHITPYSYGHFELLLRDNAPAVNVATRLLGHPPTHVALYEKKQRQKLRAATAVR
ncbi:MAG: NAD-dependent epimerase/dehydratase family protein [Gammaproteobacteria bacterium]